jgi:hypothetical protein
MKTSAIGKLLEEISWGWRNVKSYRDGGLSDENVLTVEVFQILDFLPRTLFLGEVLKSATGAQSVREQLVREIEEAKVDLLPGNSYLIPSQSNVHSKAMAVQPDARVESPTVLTLIEAKRIKKSSFQPEQLAREHTLVMRDASSKNKLPLLLLVLGEAPPIKVQRSPKLSIHDAIAQHIESVLSRAENHSFDKEFILNAVPEVVAWITWAQIRDTLEKQIKAAVCDNESINKCVERLAQTAIQAIKIRYNPLL